MSAGSAPIRKSDGQSERSELDDLLSRPAISRELAIVKMENEVMMAECRVRPRDFDEIKADLLSQLKAFPELATDAVYEKPVGKDDTGKQKYVRGLSIRAAETLAESYRYNRIRSDVAEVDGDKVKIEATFTDFQGGRIWQDAGLLSKSYKDRYGKVQRYNDDRFYNVVVKAEVSKRVREVILRSVNSGLKAWFESECEKIAGGLLDDNTINKIVSQFSSKDVTEEMLEGLIGRPREMGWTQADRTRLLGVWNAIKDGETSVAEVFADKPETPLPETNKKAPSLPVAKSDVDQAAVNAAREAFGVAQDEQGVGFELEGLLKHEMNEATRKAIEGEAEARRRAILNPPAKGGKQKELVK